MRLSDQDIIRMIKEDNPRVWKHIEKKYYGLVESIVVTNSGTREEAVDLFQEVLVAVFINVKKPNFSLTCLFKTYLFQIARNQWMSILRKKKKEHNIKDFMQYSDETETEDEIRLKVDKEIKLHKIYQYMPNLGAKCQDIIRLFVFKKMSIKEIVQKLGMKNENVAKATKSRCLKNLKQLVN